VGAATANKGGSDLAAAVICLEAKTALVGLSRKPSNARDAVATALDALGSNAVPVDLIREALRRCPGIGAAGS
jgi:hypothetical protein